LFEQTIQRGEALISRQTWEEPPVWWRMPAPVIFLLRYQALGGWNSAGNRLEKDKWRYLSSDFALYEISLKNKNRRK
jgi:hypothetical protein